MGFKCNGYDLVKEVFLTETDIIDRYVGSQLWSWGYGSGLSNKGSGQLGNNTSTPNLSSPVQTVSRGTNWELVDASSNHSAAIKTDGTLWLWGRGSYGRLGNNETISRSSPVQTVSTGNNWRQVSAAGGNSAAIKTDGTLWIWGGNSQGGLGNNSTTDRSSPVQTVSSGTNWKQVSVGDRHSAAIKTDGTLWLWGYGSFGRLGINSTTPLSSPVQTVSQGTNWKQVDLGFNTSAAIKTDGTLWIWGAGCLGQLGTNSTIHQSSPVQTVTTGTNWKQVSSSGSHSAAIKIDGTLWMWGYDCRGTLGTNSTSSRSSPVQTVSSGTNWKQVSLGRQHSSAIKTDGTLWLWGCNTNATLGDNSSTNKSSPVQTVSTGNNWKQVSAGGYHTAAVTFTEF